MKKTLKTALLALSGIFLVFGAFSCSSPGVPQQDYDNVKAQLDQANAEIATLKSQLAEATAQQVQYQQLNASFQQLKQQNDANVARINSLETQNQALESQVANVTAEKQALQASYDDLQAKYQDLEAKYEALTAPVQPITEDAVEQAIFALVNQERLNHGLALFGWGKNMYQLAKNNSKTMATDGKYEYAMWNFYQQLFWAAGYSSVDNIAHGAMLIWTNNQYQYEHGMLSTAFKYCAIGAYKQGDVVYITSMMSDFP